MSGGVFGEGSIDWEEGGNVIDSDFYLLVKSFGLVPPLPSTYPHRPELLPNHFSIVKVLHSF